MRGVRSRNGILSNSFKTKHETSSSLAVYVPPTVFSFFLMCCFRVRSVRRHPNFPTASRRPRPPRHHHDALGHHISPVLSLCLFCFLLLSSLTFLLSSLLLSPLLFVCLFISCLLPPRSYHKKLSRPPASNRPFPRGGGGDRREASSICM